MVDLLQQLVFYFRKKGCCYTIMALPFVLASKKSHHNDLSLPTNTTDKYNMLSFAGVLFILYSPTRFPYDDMAFASTTYIWRMCYNIVQCVGLVLEFVVNLCFCVCLFLSFGYVFLFPLFVFVFILHFLSLSCCFHCLVAASYQRVH